MNGLSNLISIKLTRNIGHLLMTSLYSDGLGSKVKVTAGRLGGASRNASSCFITLASSNRKRDVTVWRPSVCQFRRHTHRDSPGGSMRGGQPVFRPDNKEDRRTCFHVFKNIFNVFNVFEFLFKYFYIHGIVHCLPAVLNARAPT